MRRLEPAQQVFNVGIPMFGGPAERGVANLRLGDQPGVGNEFYYFANDIRCGQVGHLRVYVAKREERRRLEQDVIFDHGESVAAALQVVGPGMVEVESCTMINEPESTVPHEHVRVARGTVNISHVSVEPRQSLAPAALMRDRSRLPRAPRLEPLAPDPRRGT